MTAFPLLAVSLIMKVVAVLFVVSCVALILIILVQKGRGGGLSGAFGGAMASGILGSKTGDFLTWVTIVLTGIFLTLAVVMAKFYRHGVSDYGMESPVQQQMPTKQQQAEPSGEAAEQAEITDDSNTVGTLESAQPETPAVPEQTPTAGLSETQTRGSDVISEVNLPIN
jgi:preprotein translocase subunit SecG